MDLNFVQVIAIYAIPVILAITLHEAAHGYVAMRLGDLTAYAAGGWMASVGEADREPIAGQITLVGSIKWRENQPFDVHDLGRLAQQRDRMPGAEPETPMLAVSRAGSGIEGMPLLGPEDLLTAYTLGAG
jgi:hypothetical protein